MPRDIEAERPPSVCASGTSSSSCSRPVSRSVPAGSSSSYEPSSTTSGPTTATGDRNAGVRLLCARPGLVVVRERLVADDAADRFAPRVDRCRVVPARPLPQLHGGELIYPRLQDVRNAHGREGARGAHPRRGRREVSELGGLGLATVLVGDDPASDVYIRLKHKAAAEVGIELTRRAAARDDVRGGGARGRRGAERRRRRSTGSSSSCRCPDGIDEARVIARDRSGQGRRRPASAERGPALARHGRRTSAATPLGVLELLDEYGVELAGRERRRARPQRHRRQARRARCCCSATRPSRSAIRARAISPRRSRGPTCSSPRSACRASCSGDWIKPGATVIDVGHHAHGGRARRRRRARRRPSAPAC